MFPHCMVVNIVQMNRWSPFSPIGKAQNPSITGAISGWPTKSSVFQIYTPYPIAVSFLLDHDNKDNYHSHWWCFSSICLRTQNGQMVWRNQNGKVIVSNSSSVEPLLCSMVETLLPWRNNTSKSQEGKIGEIIKDNWERN